MAPPFHAHSLPHVDAAEVFARVAHRAGVFWLDSSLTREHDGRYSVMGFEPRSVFTARGDTWQVRARGAAKETGARGALTRLDAWLTACGAHALKSTSEGDACASLPALPFVGGAVGWLSYDLGRQFEFLAGTAIDDLGTPDIHLAWYEAALVWDHRVNRLWAVAPGGVRDPGESFARLIAALEEPPRPYSSTSATAVSAAHSDMGRAAYENKVAAVREGIARGEYYQLNLVQRFACAHREHPAATYLRLRSINPAPFAAYIDGGDFVVLSSSPERLIEVTPAGVARTCPIKGTRARRATVADDEAARAALLASEKERAELLMIVDLLRNDLGRVCEPGSVHVTRLHALETFATVHHLVGEVRGRLRGGLRWSELLRAIFPGGSITGAPKVSAMRAIDALEPHRRGIGMGAIGYFSADGRLDLNVAIRTVVVHGGTAYLPVGAGIVWDSEPSAEYEETLAKARAPLAALNATAS